MREAVVWAAVRRVQAGDADIGFWVTRAAANDPDPPLVNYSNDPEGAFNYHERVKRGEDPATSASVRASVCWLIQALIVKWPDRAWDLIDTLERLCLDDNLYIRENVMRPSLGARRAPDARGSAGVSFQCRRV